jgi:large subunit ribosomal protein L4
MPTVDVRTAAGKKSGTVELNDEWFGVEPNVPVMHQVVTAQLAARRSGTQSTKTRAEVRGGGAKPWRQKGTGRARQGSIRSPQWRGGGVALGPKPRSYAQRTPKKMVRLALRSALSDRAADGKVAVVDSWGFDAPSTKLGREALATLGIEGRVLMVLRRDDAVSALSFRNLPEVHLLEADQLNAYDVLVSDWVVFTSDALPGADAATSAKADDAKASKASKADDAKASKADDATNDDAKADDAKADDAKADDAAAPAEDDA